MGVHMGLEQQTGRDSKYLNTNLPVFSHEEKPRSRERGMCLGKASPSVGLLIPHSQGEEQRNLTRDSLCGLPVPNSKALLIKRGAVYVVGPPGSPGADHLRLKASALSKGWGECTRFGYFYST